MTFTRRISICYKHLASMLLLSALIAVPATGDDFPAIYDDQREEIPLTTPREALQSLELPEGYQATLFAGDPDVRQPISATMDERGRLWVAENYTYAANAQSFDDSLRDRVVIFTDADHDGHFDKRTVFWDEGQLLTSVEVGFGGVWVLCPPQLLFIPDRNRDDIPDGPPEVLLDGWVIDDVAHNFVSGLKWGLDGWLYGAHGILATSNVGLPGATDDERQRINCGIWRYHPTRKLFEIVAHGTTNPWGMDFNDHGQQFVINTVIGHLWHVIPGARFRRMYGEHFNPHTYDVIEQTADHFHWDTSEVWSDIRHLGVTDTTDAAGGGHSHAGLMIYLADNWPAALRGSLFMLNQHGRRMNRDRLERSGSGYTARHEPDFLRSNDHWFRGIDLFYGPDGGVFVLDWSDIGECHDNDGVHRSSGRIFKITYGTADPPRHGNLALLSNAELVQLQRERNDWYVRQARKLLQERAAEGRDMASARPALIEMFTNEPDVPRKLRAMWALYGAGLVDESWLLSQTEHANEHVRAWSVRLLADIPTTPPPAVVRRFGEMAASETSGLVRLYLASALRLLAYEDRLRIAEKLLQHAEDADDRLQPLLVWYAIEPAVIALPEVAIRVAQTSQIGSVQRYIVRRLASALQESPASFSSLLNWVGKEPDEGTRLEILRGMAAALKGWRNAPTPERWSTVRPLLIRQANEEILALVRELGVVFHDQVSAAEVRRLMSNASVSAPQRRQALQTFVESRPEDLFAAVRPLVTDPEMAGDAVRALARTSDPGVVDVVIDALPQLSAADGAAAVATLSTRPEWALALLDALAAGRVPRHALNASHAQQLNRLGSERVAQRLVEVWGDVRETTASRRGEMERWQQFLRNGALQQADREHGRAVFTRACANCHMLHGQGGKTGPDLTGGQRSNLNYLLENIIDPSASVARDFRAVTVVLIDGRVITGVVATHTEQTLTLQTAQERITIDRGDVDELSESEESIMPQGILKTLSEEEVVDLIAYLMS